MAPSSLHKIVLSLELFAVLAHGYVDISGEAVTSRYWDCCKPSCAWGGKAAVSEPVLSCDASDKPTGNNQGSGCQAGGSAFPCSNQQPWAINDTFSYGFVGAYVSPKPAQGATEDGWCCACYRLDFTSEPLIGKSMIVQASNTAYDVISSNRFSIAVPGGNTTSDDGCARQFGVSQSVFGQVQVGISSEDDCKNLPQQLQAGCQWKFEWYKDAQYPRTNFTRVQCPKELTDVTKCIRNDDNQVTGEGSSAGTPSLAAHFTPSSVSITGLFAALTGLLWI